LFFVEFFYLDMDFKKHPKTDLKDLDRLTEQETRKDTENCPNNALWRCIILQRGGLLFLPGRPLPGTLTGTGKNYTRDEAEARAEALGARAASSVSSATDHLVVGRDPGSKPDQAQKQDPAILEEADFSSLLQDQG
jgi:NAD-dependent DNA ligase